MLNHIKDWPGLNLVEDLLDQDAQGQNAMHSDEEGWKENVEAGLEASYRKATSRTRQRRDQERTGMKLHTIIKQYILIADDM